MSSTDCRSRSLRRPASCGSPPSVAPRSRRCAAIATLRGDRGDVVLLTIGFFLAGIAWSALLAYGIAGSRRLLGPTLVRAFSALSGLLFLYFALRIFLDGVRDLNTIVG